MAKIKEITMFKRIFLFVLCLPFVITSSLGQPPHTFTQYTSENGLSQKTVQNIMQDHKGLMWFTTWDGLYKLMDIHSKLQSSPRRQY